MTNRAKYWRRLVESWQEGGLPHPDMPTPRRSLSPACACRRLDHDVLRSVTDTTCLSGVRRRVAPPSPRGVGS
jgi:hypothetical protein